MFSINVLHGFCNIIGDTGYSYWHKQEVRHLKELVGHFELFKEQYYHPFLPLNVSLWFQCVDHVHFEERKL